MNKLNKILIAIVISILGVALIIMIILFFNMKNVADMNYSMYETQKDFSNFLEEQLDEYRQEESKEYNQE